MRPRLDLSPGGSKRRSKGTVDIKAHVITTVLLVAVVAIIALLWAHPILLLYLFLAVVGVMAYAAVYLVVSARLVEDDALEQPAEAGTNPKALEGTHDEVAEEDRAEDDEPPDDAPEDHG